MTDFIQCLSWRVEDDSPSTGWLPLYFQELPGLDTLFEAAIDRLEMGRQYEELFLPTKPRWYGLWVDQRLNLQQVQFIRTILWDLVAFHPELEGGLLEFLTVLDQVDVRRLTVQWSTPGHSDFGWNTQFVHCPRCHVEGPIPRWEPSYPENEIRCAVCQLCYSPAATYRVWKDYLHIGSVVPCESCGQQLARSELLETELDALESRGALIDMTNELRALTTNVPGDYARFASSHSGEDRRQYLRREIQSHEADYFVDVNCPRCHNAIVRH